MSKQRMDEIYMPGTSTRKFRTRSADVESIVDLLTSIPQLGCRHPNDETYVHQIDMSTEGENIVIVVHYRPEPTSTVST